MALGCVGSWGDWVQRKLGEVADFKNGMNFSKGAMGHGHPFVNLQNLFGRTLVDTSSLGFAESTDQQRIDYNLQKGDVLFVRSSVKPDGVGEAAIVPCDLPDTTYSGFIIRCRMTDGFSDDFKQFLFGTNAFRTQMLNNATTSANTNINQDSLCGMTIAFPSGPEQTAIGTFFRALDSIIAFQRRKLDGLRQLKKAYLEQMFPHLGETAPRMRFAGFGDPWVRRKLGEVADFFPGLTYSPDDVVESEGTLVLRSSNVFSGEIVDADNVFVDSRVVNCNNVAIGDIIVVVRNGSRSLIGKHAQIKKEMPSTVIGAFMTGLRSRRPEIVNALLDTAQFDIEIAKNLGATINQITTGAFKKMEFFMPFQSEEQTAIGTFFRILDDAVTFNTRELSALRDLKNVYLKKLFV